MSSVNSIYPCPSCGFLIFDEPIGSYDICSICGWEDDPVQLANPLLKGGANKECLLECQQKCLTKVPADINVHRGFKRVSGWRPLTQEDCKPSENVPKTGLEYFHAAGGDNPSYYWDKSNTNCD